MFAEMPLDNRTVDKFAAWPPALARSGRTKRRRERCDLLFRRDQGFCNIEPKIRQYG
jgi:hypothetical protein